MTPDDQAPPDAADADLDDLADRLRSLRPSRLDPPRRDATLLAAARASAERSRPPARFWPALAAGLGLVALVEGVLLARRPPPVVVERVVVVREPAPPVADRAPGPAPVIAASPRPPDREPEGRSGLTDRLAARPPIEVAPRLPGPSGPELRREMLRFALSPPGDPS